jgi:hypothetical protein
MEKTKKSIKDSKKSMSVLDDIEKVKEVLTEEELRTLDELFYSMNDFNQILDDIENLIIKNNLNEGDLGQLFKIIIKIKENRIELKVKKKSDKMGMTKSFFELPEIISRKILSRA